MRRRHEGTEARSDEGTGTLGTEALGNRYNEDCRMKVERGPAYVIVDDAKLWHC